MSKDQYWGENENAVEWLDNREKATATLHGGRLKKRLLNLAEQYPDEVEVCKAPEDNDGFLVVRFPKNWVKIQAPRVMSEAERERLRLQARTAFGHDIG